MAHAVIVEGIRTPFVKAGDALSNVPAQELGRQVARELILRSEIQPGEVDEVIVGNVASPPEAANVARVIALRAAIPKDRIAHTVSRNCASGMECVSQAIERINSGQASCVVAIGVDSMSNIPVFWRKSMAEKMWKFSQAKGLVKRLALLRAFQLKDLRPQIGIQLGLTDPVSGLMMGETAEKLALDYGISREEQDQYALSSHQKAAEAWEKGRLSSEVMSLYPPGSDEGVEGDVGYRANQTVEALAKLRPYFDRRWGSVTVGNSCQVTDGAAGLLLMSEEKAASLDMEPIGRIHGFSYAGCDPARMGLGPVFATAQLLQKLNLSMADMDLIELNEAFAAQVLACLREFAGAGKCDQIPEPDRVGEVDPAKLNVNGGAIALGHPVGATGTRLILTLLHELSRRDKTRGLATLCVGGGQGGAAVIERCAKAA